MAPSSDLVRDSRLRTKFYSGHTQHTYYISGISARQRMVKREERWQRCGSLGSGAFGTVWLEKLVSDGAEAKQRAVKEIRKNMHRNTIDYSRELEAIAKFSHENYERCFVRSFGWYESGESIFIAMEYFPHGDLQEYLSNPLPELEVQQITFQILEGVAFMHDNGFAHRDLKPANILVKSKGPEWWVKIGDFGISKRAEGLTALRTLNGTPGFLAPEMLMQLGFLHIDNLDMSGRYTVAVDIWSLGEITFRALTAEPPFPIGRLGPYANGKVEFPTEVLESHGISKVCCDFVKLLMAPLPKDRLTAKEAISHAWVESQKPSSARSSLEIQSSEHFFREDPSSANLEITDASAAWSTVGDIELQASAGNAEEQVAVESMQRASNSLPDPVSSAGATIPNAEAQNAVDEQDGGPEDITMGSPRDRMAVPEKQQIAESLPATPEDETRGADIGKPSIPKTPGDMSLESRVPSHEMSMGSFLRTSLSARRTFNTSNDVRITDANALNVAQGQYDVSPYAPRHHVMSLNNSELDNEPTSLPESRESHREQIFVDSNTPSSNLPSVVLDSPNRHKQQRETQALKQEELDPISSLRRSFEHPLSAPSQRNREPNDAALGHSAPWNREAITTIHTGSNTKPKEEGVSPQNGDIATPHLKQEPRTNRFGEYTLGKTLNKQENGAKLKLAQHTTTGADVAILLYSRNEKTKISNSRKMSEIYREVAIQGRLYHPTIQRLHEMIETEKHIGLVLEYPTGGDLLEYVLQHRYLKDNAARRIFAQIASGVEYLHGRGIAHRNLKLETIFIGKNHSITITDFSIANKFNPKDELSDEVESGLSDSQLVARLNLAEPSKNGLLRGDLMKTSCGSPCYAAPELVVSDHLYTARKVDIWSCGVILYGMLAGYLPFDDDPANPDGDNINLLYKYIVSTPLTFPEYVTPHSRDLLRRILVPDPRKRADLLEVMRHSWVVSALQPTARAEGVPTRSPPTRSPSQRGQHSLPPPLPSKLEVEEKLPATGGNKRRTSEVEYALPRAEARREPRPPPVSLSNNFRTDQSANAFHQRTSSGAINKVLSKRWSAQDMKELRRRSSLPASTTPSHHQPAAKELLQSPFRVIATHEYTLKHVDDLSFKQGQSIVVLADLDENWYFGEYTTDFGEHKSGEFPKGFVRVHDPQNPYSPTTYDPSFTKFYGIKRAQPTRPAKRPKKAGGKSEMGVISKDSLERHRGWFPAKPIELSGQPHSVEIRTERARRESRKERNVPKETDSVEGAAKNTQSADILKPKHTGLFSVSTTSSKSLHFIRADIMRVLSQLGVTFREIRGGFSCQHAPSINLNKVVDSPSTPGHPSSSGTSHKRKISFSSFRGDRDEFREQQRLPQTPKSARPRPEATDRSFTNSEDSEESDGRADRRTGKSVLTGESTTHVQSDLGGSMILVFEILIVKVPLLSLHGIQFRKVDGGVWQYKNMAQTILSELRL